MLIFIFIFTLPFLFGYILLNSRNGNVALNLLTKVRSLPQLECNNCHERECLAGGLVTWNKLKEGLKVRVDIGSNDFWDGKHCTAVNINSKAANKAANKAESE